MSRILFENKKAALGFAGAIIVCAMIFSGVSGTGNSSGENESRLARGEVEAPAKTTKEVGDSDSEEKDEIAFAEDGELIDDTGGFDPDPGGDSEDEEEDSSGGNEEAPDDDSNDGVGDFDRNGYLKFDEDDI